MTSITNTAIVAKIADTLLNVFIVVVFTLLAIQFVASRVATVCLNDIAACEEMAKGSSR